MKTFWLLEDVALNTKEYYLLLLLLLLLFLFFLYEQDLHKTFGSHDPEDDDGSSSDPSNL